MSAVITIDHESEERDDGWYPVIIMNFRGKSVRTVLEIPMRNRTKALRVAEEFAITIIYQMMEAHNGLRKWS